jgi:hypothetical protein
VLVNGTDGHLYDLHYTYATNWKLDAVSGSPGSGVTLAGTPSGYAVVQSNSAFELAYVVGSNGAIYEYEYQNGAWTHLNTFTSLASGVVAVRSPSAYWYAINGAIYHKVFVEGSNGHLYVLHYGPSTNWIAPLDITGGSPPLTGSPNAHFSDQSSPPLHFVYAVDSQGNVEEFYNCDGCSQAWQRVNLGTGAGAGTVATGTPWGYTYFGQGSSVVTHILFFVDSDGHLHETFYQTRWVYQDLGAPSGTTLNGSSPNGHGDCRGIVRADQESSTSLAFGSRLGMCQPSSCGQRAPQVRGSLASTSSKHDVRDRSGRRGPEEAFYG